MSEPLVVQALGKRCPLPVIMLAKLAAGQPAGTRIEVLADDPAAAVDIPAWCRMRGHTFVATEADRHTVELR
ncbi:sulfurtransferase TusA family protein [Dactylosporangium aurantiacum]|uniref:Sulfurtransferase TusA family protein n=1 Tax=Dactylosporangium aurantiacum TaxID=35754 RepID=A0A9Q9IDH1_9ACTN|nr:sulfurtransferase TusA family protein [Dactylosporangium aurantiacum]MDG6102408.1 sulfurtransferase TusA family protein [Dactylosporangium aurantiacum]UWZ53301.1 sulfurtransferase TusA family protein [Dactylosporangium aurantiacum]